MNCLTWVSAGQDLSLLCGLSCGTRSSKNCDTNSETNQEKTVVFCTLAPFTSLCKGQYFNTNVSQVYTQLD